MEFKIEGGFCFRGQSCLGGKRRNLFKSLLKWWHYLCVQTSREPAKDWRVFSDFDAPDEVHVCSLLFQPSICSQCTHTTQVKENAIGLKDRPNVKRRCRELVRFFWSILKCFMCVTAKNWGSTWSQKGHPLQESWPWPLVWANPSPDWRDTLHCWKNWTGTCRLTSSHLLPNGFSQHLNVGNLWECQISLNNLNYILSMLFNLKCNLKYCFFPV